jgi:hypothetical protein
MPMPSIFSKHKEPKEIVSRVKTLTSQKDSEVRGVVDAALYPAKVNSRKRIKLVQFAIRVIGIVLVSLVIISVFGLFEPLRKFTQNVQGVTGGILVSSEFVAVNVALDGKQLGTSPYSGQNIAVGMHELQISVLDDKNDYFADFSLPLQVNEGNVSVIALNPAPTTSGVSYSIISSEKRNRESDPVLIVKGIPVDATVSIDGVAIGETPVMRSDLIEGAHRVSISKAGHKTAEVDVEVSHSKIVTVEMKLYQYQLKLEQE